MGQERLVVQKLLTSRVSLASGRFEAGCIAPDIPQVVFPYGGINR